MNTSLLQQWIDHPEELNRDTLYELRTQLSRYPYFQTLRLLLLKNLYLLRDPSFHDELRRSALLVADRKAFFYLIEGSKYQLQPQRRGGSTDNTHPEDFADDRTLSLINAYLSTLPEEESDSTTLDYGVDYTNYLMSQSPAEEGEALGGEIPLIDAFLQSVNEERLDTQEPLITEGRMMTEAPLVTEERLVSDERLSPADVEISKTESLEPELSTEEGENGCFTETLAKIYVKQGRYEKAHEILKKLSLKNPKKNAYFADQIRFLEKLIINAKTKE